MAHDEGRRGSRSERDERGERAPEWRGDDGFGGGWGNQVPRPHRLGDRNYRGPADDPGYGPRYGEGAGHGYGAGGWYGPDAADSDYRYGGPGLDAEFGGPRFDRADVGSAGSAGSHGAHPVASASSPGYDMGAGGMFGSSARAFAIRREARHDPHYADWRHRQMAEFDRDYDEYRSENQSRFDREFGDWRRRRGEQRAAVGRVREHMEVTGSDGGHVGTVDCTRGDRIVLTRSDEASGGVHHAIPCAWIDKVEDKVVLNIEAEEARRRWQTENRSRALFEREDLGRRGPHVLNRSFAGTYSDEE
jgi:hypothetical protein